MSIPPLNEKLIACVLEHIENNPKEWDQSEWLDCRGDAQNGWCGTTGCFAGWAVALSTPPEKWPPTDGRRVSHQARRQQMSTRPRLNWHLIGKVLRYIKRHPERYDQNTWCEYQGDTRYSERLGVDTPVTQPNMCDTKGCFAGWAVMLSSTQREWRRILRDAVRDDNTIDYVGETAARCGFTYKEADYLTNPASGIAGQDYETIRNRICAIVRARRTDESFADAEQYIVEHGRGARRGLKAQAA